MLNSKEHHFNMIQHLINHINLMYGIHKNDITHEIFYKDGEVIINDLKNPIMRGGVEKDKVFTIVTPHYSKIATQPTPTSTPDHRKPLSFSSKRKFKLKEGKEIEMPECILIVSANQDTNKKDDNPLNLIIGRQFVIDETFEIEYTPDPKKFISKIQYKLKNEEGSNQSKIIFEMNDTELSQTSTEYQNKITFENNIFTFYTSRDIENILDTTLVNYEYKHNTTLQVNILQCYDEFNESLETFSKKVNECLTGRNIHITPNPQYPSVPVALMHNKFLLTHVSQGKKDMIKLLEGIQECMGHNSSYFKIKDMPNMTDEKVEALQKLIESDNNELYNFGENVPDNYKYIKNIIACIKEKLIKILENKKFHITSDGNVYTIYLQHANILEEIQECIQTEFHKISPDFTVITSDSTNSSGDGADGADTGSVANGDIAHGDDGVLYRPIVVPENPKKDGWELEYIYKPYESTGTMQIYKVKSNLHSLDKLGSDNQDGSDEFLCFPGGGGAGGGFCLNPTGFVDDKGNTIFSNDGYTEEQNKYYDKLVEQLKESRLHHDGLSLTPPSSSSSYQLDKSIDEIIRIFKNKEEEERSRKVESLANPEKSSFLKSFGVKASDVIYKTKQKEREDAVETTRTINSLPHENSIVSNFPIVPTLRLKSTGNTTTSNEGQLHEEKLKIARDEYLSKPKTREDSATSDQTSTQDQTPNSVTTSTHVSSIIKDEGNSQSTVTSTPVLEPALESSNAEPSAKLPPQPPSTPVSALTGNPSPQPKLPSSTPGPGAASTVTPSIDPTTISTQTKSNLSKLSTIVKDNVRRLIEKSHNIQDNTIGGSKNKNKLLYKSHKKRKSYKKKNRIIFNKTYNNNNKIGGNIDEKEQHFREDIDNYKKDLIELYEIIQDLHSNHGLDDSKINDLFNTLQYSDLISFVKTLISNEKSVIDKLTFKYHQDDTSDSIELVSKEKYIMLDRIIDILITAYPDYDEELVTLKEEVEKDEQVLETDENSEEELLREELLREKLLDQESQGDEALDKDDQGDKLAVSEDKDNISENEDAAAKATAVVKASAAEAVESASAQEDEASAQGDEASAQGDEASATYEEKLPKKLYITIESLKNRDNDTEKSISDNDKKIELELLNIDKTSSNIKIEYKNKTNDIFSLTYNYITQNISITFTWIKFDVYKEFDLNTEIFYGTIDNIYDENSFYQYVMIIQTQIKLTNRRNDELTILIKTAAVDDTTTDIPKSSGIIIDQEEESESGADQVVDESDEAVAASTDEESVDKESAEVTDEALTEDVSKEQGEKEKLPNFIRVEATTNNPLHDEILKLISGDYKLIADNITCISYSKEIDTTKKINIEITKESQENIIKIVISQIHIANLLGSQIKFYCQQFNCDFSSSNFIDSLIIILNKSTDFENFQKTTETPRDDKYPANINLKIQPIQNISEEQGKDEVTREEGVVSEVLPVKKDRQVELNTTDTLSVVEPSAPKPSAPEQPVKTFVPPEKLYIKIINNENGEFIELNFKDLKNKSQLTYTTSSGNIKFIFRLGRIKSIKRNFKQIQLITILVYYSDSLYAIFVKLKQIDKKNDIFYYLNDFLRIPKTLTLNYPGNNHKDSLNIIISKSQEVNPDPAIDLQDIQNNYEPSYEVPYEVNEKYIIVNIKQNKLKVPKEIIVETELSSEINGVYVLDTSETDIYYYDSDDYGKSNLMIIYINASANMKIIIEIDKNLENLKIKIQQKKFDESEQIIKFINTYHANYNYDNDKLIDNLNNLLNNGSETLNRDSDDSSIKLIINPNIFPKFINVTASKTIAYINTNSEILGIISGEYTLNVYDLYNISYSKLIEKDRKINILITKENNTTIKIVITNIPINSSLDNSKIIKYYCQTFNVNFSSFVYYLNTILNSKVTYENFQKVDDEYKNYPYNINLSIEPIEPIKSIEDISKTSDSDIELGDIIMKEHDKTQSKDNDLPEQFITVNTDFITVNIESEKLKIPKKIHVDSDPPSTMTGTYELDKSLNDSEMPDIDYYTNIYSYNKGNLMIIYINFSQKKRIIIEIDKEIETIKIKIHQIIIIPSHLNKYIADFSEKYRANYHYNDKKKLLSDLNKLLNNGSVQLNNLLYGYFDVSFTTFIIKNYILKSKTSPEIQLKQNLGDNIKFPKSIHVQASSETKSDISHNDKILKIISGTYTLNVYDESNISYSKYFDNRQINIFITKEKENAIKIVVIRMPKYESKTDQLINYYCTQFDYNKGEFSSFIDYLNAKLNVKNVYIVKKTNDQSIKDYPESITLTINPIEPTYKKLPEVPEKVDDLKNPEPTSKKLPEVPEKVDDLRKPEHTSKEFPEVPKKVDDLRKPEHTSKEFPEVPKKVDNNGFFSNIFGLLFSDKSKKVDEPVDKPVDELNNFVNPKVVNKPKEKQPSKGSFKEKLELPDTIYIYSSNLTDFKFGINYNIYCTKDVKQQLHNDTYICLYQYTNTKNDILFIRQKKDYYIINYITANSYSYKSHNLTYEEIIKNIENGTKIILYNTDTPKQDDIELIISLVENSSLQKSDQVNPVTTNPNPSFTEPSPLKSLAPELFPLKSLAPESPSLKSLASKPLSQNQSFIEPSPSLELSSIEPLSPQPPPLTTAITSSPTVSSSARNEPPTNSPLIQKLDNAVGAHSELKSELELEKEYNALLEEIQDQKIMADLNTLSDLDNLFGSNGKDAITKLDGDPRGDPHYYKNINKVIEHQNNRIQELKKLLQLSNRKVYIPGEKQDDYLFSYTINLGTGIELKEWIPNYKDFPDLYNVDDQFNPNFFKLKIQKNIDIIKTNTQLKNYLIMIYNLYKQLNDLFEKFHNQVIFVYSPYNYLTKKIRINIDADPIEVIPGNDSIHIWGANVTNWNLLPCDPYSITLKMDGSCDTKCHYNNNIDGYIDGSGQAKNIGYQRVGIFGIVTMPVDNSDILKLESVSLTNKCYNPPIIPLFIYINIDGKIYVLDYKNMVTKGTKDKQYYIYYRNNNNGIALLFITDKNFIQKYILLDLPQQQKFRYSIHNKNNNGFKDVINIFINQINTLPTKMKFSNISDKKKLSNKIVVKISFNRPSLEQSPTLLPPTPPPPSAPTSLQSPGAPPPPPPKGGPKGGPNGGNNSPKFKKKYTYKYMARRKGRRIRSRKQRGGVFGASQWAPALIGNNVSQQEAVLQGNINSNSSIMDKINTYQGGSKGGNIGNVLAQGAVPASLFAANYMYSPGRKSRKRNSQKRYSKKNKKASRKFRLF